MSPDGSCTCTVTSWEPTSALVVVQVIWPVWESIRHPGGGGEQRVHQRIPVGVDGGDVVLVLRRRQSLVEEAAVRRAVLRVVVEAKSTAGIRRVVEIDRGQDRRTLRDGDGEVPRMDIQREVVGNEVLPGDVVVEDGKDARAVAGRGP